MKKLIGLIGALIICMNISAQVTLEGDVEYGRLEDMTYHPNIQNRVYAVTLNSHIVVSNDNGVTWDFFFSFPDEGARIQQLDLMGSTGLSFFVSQSTPSNNTLYIIDIDTAEIIKEFPAPVTAVADSEWIKDYDIYEANPNVAILNEGYKIGTDSNYIVYYTVNGGATWSAVYIGDNNTNDKVSVNNVAIHPNNSSNIFISRGAGPTDVDGGLLVSLDGGTSFVETLTGIELNAFKFDPNNASVMYLGTGWSGDSNIYKSIDSGSTWNVMDEIPWDNSGPINQVNYIEINPSNSNDILVLGGDEVAISIDGGESWNNYVYDIDNDLYIYGMKASYNPFNTDEVLVAVDRYPVKSTDGGVTFVKMDNPFFFSEFVDYNPSGNGHLYYGANSGIVHYDFDSGVHTMSQETPLGTFNITPKNYFPDRYVAGRSYYRLGQGILANVLVLGNHGASITGLLIGNITSQIVDVETDPNNTNEVWMSFHDGVTRSFDVTQNSSFNEITLPIVNNPPPAPQILHFTTFFNPADSNHVLIGQGGRVFESFDKGVNWTLKSNGIDAYLDVALDVVYDIEQNPNNANELIASTSQGIFKTIDFGENWSRVYEGEYLRKIEYSTENDGVIIASVYSSLTTSAHLVYSIDNGENWIEVLRPLLEYVGSGSMDFQFESGLIHTYIATFDSGVIKYTIDIEALSIPDISLGNTFNFYPNPVKESVNFKTNNQTVFNTVTIFDINGKRVFETEFANQINLSSLQAGIYLMRLKDNEGNFYVKKVIKK